MKLLKVIKDNDLKPNAEIRNAVRAVLFDDKNLVPLLFVSKNNYHKLPGGGIEKGENKIQALVREVKEEVGSEIEIGEGIGEVIEFRSEFNMKQTSYCYLGKVLSKGDSKLEQDEIDEGFELVWVTLSEAILLIKNDTPKDYQGKFIQLRDLAFLLKAKEIFDKKL